MTVFFVRCCAKTMRHTISLVDDGNGAIAATVRRTVSRYTHWRSEQPVSQLLLPILSKLAASLIWITYAVSI